MGTRLLQVDLNHILLTSLALKKAYHIFDPERSEPEYYGLGKYIISLHNTFVISLKQSQTRHAQWDVNFIETDSGTKFGRKYISEYDVNYTTDHCYIIILCQAMDKLLWFWYVLYNYVRRKYNLEKISLWCHFIWTHSSRVTLG